MRNILLLLTVGMAILCSAEDSLTLIEQKAGTLASQLVGYQWQSLENRGVPAQALTNAFGWACVPLKDEFCPSSNCVVSVHHRDKGTCDAIKMDYEKGGHRISIAQARWPMLIVIEGPDTKASSREDAESAVRRVAAQCLRYSEEYSFEVDEVGRGDLWIGRPQFVKSEKRSKRAGKESSLYLLSWWSDGKRVSFYGLHFPGGSQEEISVDPTTELEFNQRWFDRYSTKH